jgi:hypothetical protein
MCEMSDWKKRKLQRIIKRCTLQRNTKMYVEVMAAMLHGEIPGIKSTLSQSDCRMWNKS